MAMAELVECSLCPKKGVERHRLRACGNLFPEEPCMQPSVAPLTVQGMRGRRAVSHTRNPWATYVHHGWSRDFRR